MLSHRLTVGAILCSLMSFLLWDCLAGPPPSGQEPQMPIAGPPPEHDYLPPLDPRARARAAGQMTAVVVIGLLVVLILLRWVSRGRRAQELATADPIQELVAKAQEALQQAEQEERQRGPGPPP